MDSLNPKMDLASMNVGMEFEQEGIFSSNYGVRDSINSTSTLGRQVAAEEETYGEQTVSAITQSQGRQEAFQDRTNMIVNPMKRT